MRNIFFLILFICLSACNKYDNIKILNDEADSSTEINTHEFYYKKFYDENRSKNLAKKIIREGDTVAFEELKEVYYNSENKREFLYYSVFMANTYNYNYAFYTCYSLLMTDIITEQNKVNNIQANYYLLKSYELGYKKDLYALKQRFDTLKELPNSKEYLLKNLK